MEIQVFTDGVASVRARAASDLAGWLRSGVERWGFSVRGFTDLVEIGCEQAAVGTWDVPVLQSRERPATDAGVEEALLRFANAELEGVLLSVAAAGDRGLWSFEPGWEVEPPTANGGRRACVELRVFRWPGEVCRDDVLEWAGGVFESMIESHSPVFGRVGGSGGPAWWDLRNAGRLRSGFAAVAHERIRAPEWMIYLTEGHLRRVPVATLESAAFRVWPCGDGVVVQLADQIGAMEDEAFVETWIQTLAPALY